MADLWVRVGHREPCPLTTPCPAREHEQDEPAHHHRKPLLPSQSTTNSLLLWLQRCRALAIGRSRCSRPARTSNGSNVSDNANDNSRQLRCFAAALAVEAAHRAVARAAAVP